MRKNIVGGDQYIPDYNSYKWLQQDLNPQPFTSQTNTQPFNQAGYMVDSTI